MQPRCSRGAARVHAGGPAPAIPSHKLQAARWKPHVTSYISLQTAEVRPVLWEENFFSLLPGERRTVAATLPLGVAGGDTPVLIVETLNGALAAAS